MQTRDRLCAIEGEGAQDLNADLTETRTAPKGAKPEFGWRINVDRQWEEVPEQIDVIQAIVELIENNDQRLFDQHDITNDLNERGYPAPRGGRWTTPTVKLLLKRIRERAPWKRVIEGSMTAEGECRVDMTRHKTPSALPASAEELALWKVEDKPNMPDKRTAPPLTGAEAAMLAGLEADREELADSIEAAMGAVGLSWAASRLLHNLLRTTHHARWAARVMAAHRSELAIPRMERLKKRVEGVEREELSPSSSKPLRINTKAR